MCLTEEASGSGVSSLIPAALRPPRLTGPSEARLFLAGGRGEGENKGFDCKWHTGQEGKFWGSSLPI